MPHSLAGQISAAFSFAVSLFAFVFGGRPERLGAVVLLTGTVLVVVLQDRSAWGDPQQRLTALDAGALLALLYLALSTKRIWVIPATSMQLLSVILRFAALTEPTPITLSVLTATSALAYGVLMMLAWGTWSVAQHRRALAMSARHADARSHGRSAAHARADGL